MAHNETLLVWQKSGGNFDEKGFYTERACMLGPAATAAGISLIFHAYLSSAVYELLVKKVAQRWNLANHRGKLVYDCVSCLVSVILSLSFFGFGHFVGIHVGTVICALVSGWSIGRCTSFLEAHYVFQDRFPLRRYF